MLYEINNSNIDSFIQKINEKTLQTENLTHRLVIYHNRTVNPNIKVLICTRREWLSFQQFNISTEHMKGNLDVICNVEIDKSIVSLIQRELLARKEHINENTEINFSSPNSIIIGGM